MELQNERLIPGTKELLSEAVDKLPSGWRAEPLVGKNGTFALNMSKPRIVMTAKAYIYGNTISAHEKAVYSALKQGKPLVVYVGVYGRFYKFDPQKVLEKSDENVRGGEKMLNWSVRLGRRYETP